MEVEIKVAIVTGVSAIISFFVQHWLKERALDKNRGRQQIKKWRQMLLDLDRADLECASLGQQLQTHPDYITLEPFLTDTARSMVRRECRTMVVCQALSPPLEILKNEIARIEREWKL